MTQDVHIVSVDIGALNNDCRNLFKVPTGQGGITILAANAVGFSAATPALNVVNMGTAGTAAGTTAAGTVATMGSTAFAAGAPHAFTVGSYVFIDEGEWLGVEEKNVGAAPTITIVDVAYVMGK